MKVRTTVLLAVALLLSVLVLPGLVLAEASPQQPATQAPQEPVSPTTPQTTLPAPSAQTQGSAPLRVMVGKSLLINTTEQIKRISVTDPSVAYATPITPTQILVHGRSSGDQDLSRCNWRGIGHAGVSHRDALDLLCGVDEQRLAHHDAQRRRTLRLG